MPYVKAAELAELRRKAKIYDKRQKELRESFRLKTVCDTCGHQSFDDMVGRRCPTLHCEGIMNKL